LSNIDWDSNILYVEQFAYFWIRFSVPEMLSVYPIPQLASAGPVSALGDVFILEESENPERRVPSKRGRPALPWDRFHVEVAALVNANALPDKKEAAIHHFEAWFRDILGLRVGRSSIGQKLTPYYERFIRAPTKNGIG
jgi:hypothetical protein